MAKEFIDPETIEKSAYESLKTIDTWRDVLSATLERLGVSDTSKAKQQVESKAIGDISVERYEALNAIAAKQMPKPIKHLLTIAIGAFGALAIGSAINNLGDSNGRNPLVIGAGSLTGGIVAVVTDKYLESFFTKRKMRKYAEAAISRAAKES